MELGEWTVAGNPVVVLTDLSAVEIELAVDEVDIGSVAVGQPALVTLETWPQDELRATVTRIAPAANTQTGLVTYHVYLSLDTDGAGADFTVNNLAASPDALVIRPGMTANAEIVTHRLADVLLVPNRAIQADRAAGRYTVERVVPGGSSQSQVETVEISLGLRSATQSQILGGLEEGDVVLIKAIEKKETPLGPPGQGMFGGG
jgi:HlyD family secretion protein